MKAAGYLLNLYQKPIISMKKNGLLYCLLLITSIASGCGFAELDEIMKKSHLIEKTLQESCNCDEAEVLNYSVSNGNHTTISCKMVGCPYPDKEQALKEINTLLRKKIPGFCDIDEFTIDFVNKGKHETGQLALCKDAK